MILAGWARLQITSVREVYIDKEETMSTRSKLIIAISGLALASAASLPLIAASNRSKAACDGGKSACSVEKPACDSEAKGEAENPACGREKSAEAGCGTKSCS